MLAHLIDGILEQATGELAEQLEICVSDNASQDGTEDLMRTYADRHPGRIRYRRNEGDLGAIRNIFASFELARGEYCFAIMSDDALAPRGLAAIMSALADNPGVSGVTVNSLHLDADLREVVPIFPAAIMPPSDRGTVRYTDPDRLVRDLGLLFTHDLLVRRSEWQTVVEGQRERLLAASPNFAYALVLGRVARRRPDWLWLPQVVVHNRLFASTWVEGRAYHDVHLAWLRDIAGVFRELSAGNRETYKRLLYKWYLLAESNQELVTWKMGAELSWRDDLRMLTGVARCLYPLREFWLHALPLLLVPHGLVKAMPGLRARAGAEDLSWYAATAREPGPIVSRLARLARLA
jgi:glycosyltransferase involved in cell wall biosynthesis